MNKLDQLDLNATLYKLQDSDAIHHIIDITWADLKSLRDNSNLIPGQSYKIIDYNCTTNPNDTEVKSAGHQFDVIVTADNKDTLNEVARACLHEETAQNVTIKAIQYIDDIQPENYRLDGWSNYVGSFLNYENGKIHYKKTTDPIIDDYLEFIETTTYAGVTVGKWKRVETGVTDEYTNKVFFLLDAWVVGKQLIKNESDTYFANSKLEAWELKYSIDNDTTRFAWADTVDGKGVIYFMKDEHNNECPYDFKNIQFKRYACTLANTSSIPSIPTESIFGLYSYWGTKSYANLAFAMDSTNSIWVYTFHNAVNNVDSSVIIDNVIDTYTEGQKVYGNIIKEYIVNSIIDDTKVNSVIQLNNIVFYTKVYDNELVENSTHSNVFGNNCHTMTFSKNCHSNTFGNECYENTFGNGCYFNTFNNKFYQNIFGNDCCRNSFGHECLSNSFREGCQVNSFGNDCRNNYFGGGCYCNSFGNNCMSNIFGFSCNSNNFGNNCTLILFGNRCSYNILGDGCERIDFKDFTSSDTNEFDLASDVSNNIFDNNVRSISIRSTEGSYDSIMQNIHIHQGVKGEVSNKRIINVNRNETAQINIVPAGTKTIEI